MMYAAEYYLSDALNILNLVVDVIETGEKIDSELLLEVRKSSSRIHDKVEELKLLENTTFENVKQFVDGQF